MLNNYSMKIAFSQHIFYFLLKHFWLYFINILQKTPHTNFTH